MDLRVGFCPLPKEERDFDFFLVRTCRIPYLRSALAMATFQRTISGSESRATRQVSLFCYGVTFLCHLRKGGFFPLLLHQLIGTWSEKTTTFRLRVLFCPGPPGQPGVGHGPDRTLLVVSEKPINQLVRVGINTGGRRSQIVRLFTQHVVKGERRTTALQESSMEASREVSATATGTSQIGLSPPP